MRTLTLLAAIFLLALQAQAEPLPEIPEDALEEHHQEDHLMAISFEGAESSGPQDSEEILATGRLYPRTAKPGQNRPPAPRPGLRHRPLSPVPRPRPHPPRPGSGLRPRPLRPTPRSPPLREQVQQPEEEVQQGI